MLKRYETVIGLEVHIELNTKTKIFCGCSTGFGADPNTHICPVCIGMPGALPVLNKSVVEKAAAVGMALHCRVNSVCRFDRKNYFYPDNAQNYQISQLYLPVCYEGFISVGTKSGRKKVRIHELHMEEDAGKLIHDEWEDCSLVDYNRSGVPLIEIVSEPDMRNAEEVIACLEELRHIVRYLRASDCKLQEGSMRVDVNLSVREEGSGKLGVRTEMKNLNSFKAVRRAIEAEQARQIEILEEGGGILQETRRWDDNKESSYPMRSKEDAQDYRYFPDPDLPPVFLHDEWLQKIRLSLPEFAPSRKRRYMEQYELSEYETDMITDEIDLAELFENTVAAGGKPKETANWIMTEVMRLMKENAVEASGLAFSPEHLAELLRLLEHGQVNRRTARKIFEVIFNQDAGPEAYAKEKGLLAISDRSFIEETVQKVLLEAAQAVEDYKKGKEKSFGYLVGQTMRALHGKADPGIVREVLLYRLEQFE